MKPILPLLCLLFFITSCSHKAPGTTQATGIAKSKPIGKVDDTVLFEKTSSKQNLPQDFDDNNSIVFKNGIKITATTTGDDSYLLKISRGKERILSKDSVKGVSKVLLDDNKLFFSVFTYVDEDGNNAGLAFIVDLKDGKVLKYPDTLKNTCNPIRYRDDYLFLDQGRIIRTTLSLKPAGYIKLSYRSPGKDNAFLDTYSINGLAKPLVKDGNFCMIFTPDKSSIEAMPYEGRIAANTKTIVLSDAKSRKVPQHQNGKK